MQHGRNKHGRFTEIMADDEDKIEYLFYKGYTYEEIVGLLAVDFRIKMSLSTLKRKLKEGLQSVLRIGSAHNKGGPPSTNIVQISHFLDSF